MSDLEIALVGQPNTGKSALYNAIVGPKVTVSNYPGTTVDVARAEMRLGEQTIEFVDTPGIYSISDRSEEEKVTERILFKSEIDGTIVLVDATSLERSLYFVLQILEAGIPAVLALNFVEEAEAKGIHIDTEQLEDLLGVPVVAINPLTGKGVDSLVEVSASIGDLTEQRYQVEYDDHIEEAIRRVSEAVSKAVALPNRFVALRVLEGDEEFLGHLERMDVVEPVREGVEEHPDISRDISVTRFGTASWIAHEVTDLRRIQKKKSLGEQLDNVLLAPVAGPIVTYAAFLGIFSVLLVLGNEVQHWLTVLFEATVPTTTEATPVAFVLVEGLNGLTAGIAIALPYVFLFYLLLGLLEDVGVLSRFIVNLDRFLRKLNLPGKSFIPLALGLGCTAAATRATRVLASKDEQFHTSSFFAFVPCSSRIAIIMGIVGFYGSFELALSIFVTLILAGLFWGYLLTKLTDVEAEPLLIELPPYRRPVLGNVLAKSWLRMKDFVYVVLPLLMVGGTVYGLLELRDIPRLIVDPLAPISSWLGLPGPAMIPLVFGFIQKDLTGPMLLSVLGRNLEGLSMLQIYAFGVASTIGIPCVIALAMLWKEFGWRRSILLTTVSVSYGYLFAGIAWRVVAFLVPSLG